MKKILSMRLLGVMAIAAIALSNVLLSACSEDDDLEMNSSTLAKGLMTRSGEGSDSYPPYLSGIMFEAGGDTSIVQLSSGIDIEIIVSWDKGSYASTIPSSNVRFFESDSFNENYTFTLIASRARWVSSDEIVVFIDYSRKHRNGALAYLTGIQVIKVNVTLAKEDNEEKTGDNGNDTDDDQDYSNGVISVEYYTDNGVRMVRVHYRDGSIIEMTEDRYNSTNH